MVAETGLGEGVTADAVRAQLDLLVHDEVFRSSKRSIAFLRYVVEQTLNGSADQIKERTIGADVFGRAPSYDTNLDHVVRTAAIELRKRLAIYYGQEKHRHELCVTLVPGSYIPRFALAGNVGAEHGSSPEMFTHRTAVGPIEFPAVPHFGAQLAGHERSRRRRLASFAIVSIVVLAASGAGYQWMHRPTPEDLFWRPVLDTPGPVLLAVGDVPDGPPTAPANQASTDSVTPVLHSNPAHTVPLADAVTMARVVGALQSAGKEVVIRNENSRSFSDLRDGAVVLIGGFNNEWSLRLTQPLRYSLALDPERNLIYIKDSQHPASRSWSWATNQSKEIVGGPQGPVLQDYALISRIRNSQTGHVVVIIGGLYTYGTQSAGEFLTDPRWMQAISRTAVLDPSHPNLQIVLGTTVTDGTPGPPKVLAESSSE
ncbi:MAG TPA: hypothetical protein VN612_13710 [Acidobacteriaceae bacterium]|nr:hypothetical protein [Acidobacteriaceae bacterium]